MADVLILTGSDSDLPVLEQCHARLAAFGVSAEVRLACAHHTPARLSELVASAEADGTKVFICAAGAAAHLAGTVAAATTRPVVGLPLTTGALGGVDALYSTVNMPAGLPVATVSVGEWGAENAAILAAQILAVSNDDLAGAIREHRARLSDAVVANDEALQARRAEG
ncbi:MAG: 5-(carboxyamino)imidazole ribonucleotide mutase [Planctomycetota bacterium]|jgi:5-(carboxyamino)imidazole ribonucleotide mutase